MTLFAAAPYLLHRLEPDGPRRPVALSPRCRLRSWRVQVSQAIEQEIRTLRAHFWSNRDPEGRAFAPLADAYRRKGELAEASSLVEDGLARLPDFTPGHLIAARIGRARGDLEEARRALDRLLELDGHNVLALLERAELARDTGDAEGAMSDLRRLLELEPGHMGARAALDRLEASEGGVPSTEARDEPEPSPGGEESAVLDIEPTDLAGEPGAPEADSGTLDADFDLVTGGVERTGDEGGGADSWDEGDLDWGPSDLELDSEVAEVDFGDLELESTSLEPGAEPEPDGPELTPELEAEAEVMEPDLEPLDSGSEEEAFDPPIVDAEGYLEEDGRAAAGSMERDEDPGDPLGDADLMGDPDPMEGFDFALDDATSAAESVPEVQQESEEAAEVGDDTGDGMVTRTMGDILARQGLIGEAVRVYEQLAERDPEDVEIQDRLAELRQHLAGRDAGPAVTAGAASEGTGVDEPELRDVAPQWADEEDTEADEQVATPFAWDEEEPEEEAEGAPEVAEGRPRSISDYFDDLLAWSPGAVPVEHLAPDAPEDTAPPDSLAALGAAGGWLPADDGSTESEESTPGGSEVSAEASAADTGEEDDLDDFRDWLKSLET